MAITNPCTHMYTHTHTHVQQHAAYDPARSGAEWWVQVLDEDDDIGKGWGERDLCVYTYVCTAD